MSDWDVEAPEVCLPAVLHSQGTTVGLHSGVVFGVSGLCTSGVVDGHSRLQLKSKEELEEVRSFNISSKGFLLILFFKLWKE